MSNTTTVLPKGWAQPHGFSYGMVGEGRMLFVAGTVGWDPTSAKAKFAPTFHEQWDQALSNVLDVVREAGGAPDQVVRMTIYVTDKREYLTSLAEIGASWRKHFGKHYPAMALVQVSALVEDAAKLEIETTVALAK